MTGEGRAAGRYAARVDAVLAQRTRLRGEQPPGDLFAGLPAEHPLLKSDPRRPLEPNLEILASYVEREDVIVDVGGGAGRISLPLALRCREVVNVEPSGAMASGFVANAKRAGITNARVVQDEWPSGRAPAGTVALVNHVTYLTRGIGEFVERLEQAGPRRVLLTVNTPPPPSWHRVLYELAHGEPEEVVPGHEELLPVLWEMGILPDVRVLPLPTAGPLPPAPAREAAVGTAVIRFAGDQWSFWPLGADLERRVRGVLEARFDEMFEEGPEGFVPRWITPGREILITWQPSERAR